MKLFEELTDSDLVIKKAAAKIRHQHAVQDCGASSKEAQHTYDVWQRLEDEWKRRTRGVVNEKQT